MQQEQQEQPPEAMEAEFDTVAAWTEVAVQRLGQSHAVVAGCRGSGSPASLAWLADALGLDAGTRLLDSGAGVGGPAAWLAREHGASSVLVEPMPAASGASHRLFGLPAVLAWSEHLPLRPGSFDAAWCLGVLCTTTEKQGILAELHRVLTPGGRLGVLAFVQETDPLPEQPDGNDFPTRAALLDLLTGAGFTVTATADPAGLPSTPDAWQAQADAVEAALEDAHGDDPAWRTAQEQSGLMGRLLDAGHLRAWLVAARAGPAPT